jgi:hypothetical protein
MFLRSLGTNLPHLLAPLRVRGQRPRCHRAERSYQFSSRNGEKHLARSCEGYLEERYYAASTRSSRSSAGAMPVHPSPSQQASVEDRRKPCGQKRSFNHIVGAGE